PKRYSAAANDRHHTGHSIRAEREIKGLVPYSSDIGAAFN
ncbi:MAG: hypothetical protein UY74_C0075G0012, partial [Candidatus Kaiserbacteria bacterium GW2011_GWC2_52_8b]